MDLEVCFFNWIEVFICVLFCMEGFVEFVMGVDLVVLIVLFLGCDVIVVLGRMDVVVNFDLGIVGVMFRLRVVSNFVWGMCLLVWCCEVLFFSDWSWCL